MRRADGSVGYEEVYAFGHQDTTGTAIFTELHLATSAGGVDATIQVNWASLHMQVTDWLSLPCCCKALYAE